jgi:hypothetical protein
MLQAPEQVCLSQRCRYFCRHHGYQPSPLQMIQSQYHDNSITWILNIKKSHVPRRIAYSGLVAPRFSPAKYGCWNRERWSSQSQSRKRCRSSKSVEETCLKNETWFQGSEPVIMRPLAASPERRVPICQPTRRSHSPEHRAIRPVLLCW